MKAHVLVAIAFFSSQLVADEVRRPVAFEPLDSLTRTASEVVNQLNRPRVGERERDAAEETPVYAGNLAALSNTVSQLNTVTSVPGGGVSDLGIAQAPVSFGNRGERSLASLMEVEEMTLDEVLRSESYYSFRNFVVDNKDEWTTLRGQKEFMKKASRLFDQNASGDHNHRSREVFARFLSGTDPNTPTTTSSATPVIGSAEKTHSGK